MSHLQYFNYPGFGQRVQKETWYSQAVRIGNTIQISGQGGLHPQTEHIPDKFEAQVEQAFKNVELALQDAGGKGWEEVYSVRAFTTVSLSTSPPPPPSSSSSSSSVAAEKETEVGEETQRETKEEEEKEKEEKEEGTINILAKYLKRYCPNHQPLLTGVQVQGLAFGMLVEIEVVALMRD